MWTSVSYMLIMRKKIVKIKWFLFSDPPTVTIEKTYGRTQLICIPNGVPDKYIFRNWEHKTEYMEIIRILPSINGTLEVSESANETNRHHDRGIYICQASNNVSSSNGLFVMANFSFNPKGMYYLRGRTKTFWISIYTYAIVVYLPPFNTKTVFKFKEQLLCCWIMIYTFNWDCKLNVGK